jgi:hypothetical protein
MRDVKRLRKLLARLSVSEASLFSSSSQSFITRPFLNTSCIQNTDGAIVDWVTVYGAR